MYKFNELYISICILNILEIRIKKLEERSLQSLSLIFIVVTHTHPCITKHQRHTHTHTNTHRHTYPTQFRLS